MASVIQQARGITEAVGTSGRTVSLATVWNVSSGLQWALVRRRSHRRRRRRKRKRILKKMLTGLLSHVIIGADRSSVSTFFSLTDEKTLSLGCSSCSSSSSLTLS